ncbi:MAG: hypothetical protein Q8L10_04585 [Candidatus Moranbacteria bacterium]|nr:hypothetical protein [Candidatus Moranbacteria bacterium]
MVLDKNIQTDAMFDGEPRDLYRSVALEWAVLADNDKDLGRRSNVFLHMGSERMALWPLSRNLRQEALGSGKHRKSATSALRRSKWIYDLDTHFMGLSSDTVCPDHGLKRRHYHVPLCQISRSILALEKPFHSTGVHNTIALWMVFWPPSASNYPVFNISHVLFLLCQGDIKGLR